MIFPLSDGLTEHKERMGIAIYEYLWLLAKVTKDIPDGNGNFNGIVLRGESVSASRIAIELHESVYTARINLRRLEQERYIIRNLKRGDSYSYLITKSKKFLPKRNGNTLTKNCCTLTTRSSDPEQELSVPSQDLARPLTRSCTPNKERLRIKDRYISSETAGSDPDLESALAQVWDHYIAQAGRNPATYSFTASRQKKGLTRLGECLSKTNGDINKAIELMKVAIDKLIASDWHMGRDPKTQGKKYHDWTDNLFGSYEQMEKWWNQ